MTTRVTALNRNDDPGVWTGPQSMVQPSPILTEAEAASAVVDEGTPLAVPDTLFLRDANASGAVGTLALDGSIAAPSVPDAGFGQLYFDAASESIILENDTARFQVTKNTGDGTQLVFGGDSAINNIVSFYADAALQTGPFLTLQHDTAAATFQFDSLTFLSNTTPTNDVSVAVAANGTLEFSAGDAANVTIRTPAADGLIVEGGNGLTLTAPTGETTTINGDSVLQTFNGAVGIRTSRRLYGTVSQVGATAGDAITFAMANDTAFSFYLYVTAYTATGPATAARQFVGICRAAGGAATVVNASSFYANGDAALGAIAVAITASGANILVTCTGVAGLTTRFEAYMDIFLGQA